MIELPDDKLLAYTSALSDVVRTDPKLIMVVVPTQTADRYSAIKKVRLKK